MRTIIVSGRVVADAQKLSTASGVEYLSFRLANNEFSDEKGADGKPITHWYRVTAFDGRLANLAKYLTKGKAVNVTGRYSDKIYQNKQGVCDISRDITATIIDFQEYNRQDDGGTTANRTTTTVEIPQVTSTPQVTQAKPQPQPIVSDSDDDDLPF